MRIASRDSGDAEGDFFCISATPKVPCVQWGVGDDPKVAGIIITACGPASPARGGDPLGRGSVEGKSALLMKMNRGDRRAAEPGRTDDEPDPAIAHERLDEMHEQFDEELPPRRVRLGAAWRLPVILAAAEPDDEDPDVR